MLHLTAHRKREIRTHAAQNGIRHNIDGEIVRGEWFFKRVPSVCKANLRSLLPVEFLDAL
jgi:hypothetical protein